MQMLASSHASSHPPSMIRDPYVPLGLIWNRFQKNATPESWNSVGLDYSLPQQGGIAIFDMIAYYDG